MILFPSNLMENFPLDFSTTGSNSFSFFAVLMAYLQSVSPVQTSQKRFRLTHKLDIAPFNKVLFIFPENDFWGAISFLTGVFYIVCMVLELKFN